MLRQLTRHPSPESRKRSAESNDSRTVEAIVEAAAARVGLQSGHLVHTLAEHGVQHRWQLELCDSDDWSKLGVTSVGLKTAIKAELSNPPAAVAKSSDSELDDVHDRIRRFLLLPGPDGREPRRLGQQGAMFLALLTLPPHEMHRLTLTLCELFALVSGLILPVPLSFLRDSKLRSDVHKGWALDDMQQGWALVPTRMDCMEAIATVAFANLFIMVFVSVALALFTAATGSDASLRYYENIFFILGLSFMNLVFGVVFPLVILVFYERFVVAASPYPMVATATYTYLTWTLMAHMIWSFHIHGMALEIFHFPPWVIVFVRYVLCPFHNRALLDKNLEPLARRRAAELRARASVTLLDELARTKGGRPPTHKV